MNKRVFYLLAALAVMVVAPLVASAQMQQEPPNFVYVSEWAIPRAQWADWTASNEKNTKPIFDKLMADGTIIAYGFYTSIVHDESGITHGSWYEATSLAGIEKVSAEIAKLGPNPIANAATKHRDYLLRTSLRRAKAASGKDGYLWVNSTQLQPGKAQEWRALFDKYVKPVFDDMLANGTLLLYELEGEQVHTDNPNSIFIVYMAPSADGLDKFFSAVTGIVAKNPLLGDAIGAVTVPAAHRDYYARVNHYAQK
jgi:hypothetical protein